MSNAHLIVEAVDAAITIGKALVGWLIFLSVAAAMLILAAVATGTWSVNALRQRRAQPAGECPRRRVPSWARTQPLDDDYEEAA
ncbi:hypothetical protein [Streptomyces spinosirectus]